MSLKTKSKPVAKLALDRAIAEALVEGALPRSRSTTLHEGAKAWLADRARPLRALTKGTVTEYSSFVKQLMLVTPASMLADDVTSADIRLVLDMMQSEFHLAPTTVKKRFGALRMLFNWMVEEEMARKNPVKLSDVPFAEPQQKPPWTQDQYQALQEAFLCLRDNPEASQYWIRTSQLLADLTTALWLSGMRSVQAYRMRWEEDIDLEKMVWVVRSPRRNKGGEKLKPIHKGLERMLQRRRLLGDEGPFPSATCLYAWKVFKKRHPAFTGLSLHQCRSRVATQLHEMGESDAARKILGHTSVKNADLYDHTSLEHYREILNRISE